jgi:hypothetical protein
MAFPADNGDISRITELGRFAIPGSGHNNIGQAKNNKVLVWGRLTGLYATAGMDVLRHGNGNGGAFGLSSIDMVSLNVRKSATVNPTDEKLFLANLSVPLGKIFVNDDLGQADPAAVTAGQTVVIDYCMLGDDLTAPELV